MAAPMKHFNDPLAGGGPAAPRGQPAAVHFVLDDAVGDHARHDDGAAVAPRMVIVGRPTPLPDHLGGAVRPYALARAGAAGDCRWQEKAAASRGKRPPTPKVG
jgi:hypothetical protein